MANTRNMSEDTLHHTMKFTIRMAKNTNTFRIINFLIIVGFKIHDKYICMIRNDNENRPFTVFQKSNF